MGISWAEFPKHQVLSSETRHSKTVLPIFFRYSYYLTHPFETIRVVQHKMKLNRDMEIARLKDSPGRNLRECMQEYLHDLYSFRPDPSTTNQIIASLSSVYLTSAAERTVFQDFADKYSQAWKP